jgi:hypothetical protein
MLGSSFSHYTVDGNNLGRKQIPHGTDQCDVESISVPEASQVSKVVN